VVLPSLRCALAANRNAEVVPVAAGPWSGSVQFHVTAHSHNASVLEPRSDEMDQIYGYGWQLDRVETVPQRTVDDIASGLSEITVLKFDVQGYESAALSGATETLRRTKYIIIEVTFRSHYEGDTTFPDLHKLITNKGFFLRSVSQPFHRSSQALWADAVYERVGR